MSYGVKLDPRPISTGLSVRDLVDHHFYIPGPVLKLRHDLIESNAKEDDIAFFVQKHNRYATLLAREELRWRTESPQSAIEPSLVGNPDQRALAEVSHTGASKRRA